MALDMLEPASTSLRTSVSTSLKYLFFCCVAKMPMAWVIGKPALNITDSWRLKIARVRNPTFLEAPRKGIFNSQPLPVDGQNLDLFPFQGGHHFEGGAAGPFALDNIADLVFPSEFENGHSLLL